MTADPNEYTLARVTFDSLEEGAAFIAALSRVIASPSGAVHDASSPIEVQAAMAPSQRMDVFLSPSALATTRAAFGQPRVVNHVERRSVPVNAMRLIDHWPNRAYGQEEIVKYFGALAGMISASNAPDDDEDEIVREVMAWPAADLDRASEAFISFKAECRRLMMQSSAMAIGFPVGIRVPIATLSFARKHLPLPYEDVMDWLRGHPLVRVIEVEVLPPGYFSGGKS